MTSLNLDNINLDTFNNDNERPDAETFVQEKKKQQLSATLGEAIKVNPDQYAHINKLSKESGLPASAVETDPTAVETDLKLKKIDLHSMTRTNPATSKFLNDFDRAAVSHDDIESLRALEDAVGKLNLPSRAQIEQNSEDKNGYLSNVGRGVGERVTELLGSLYSFAAQGGEYLEEKFPVGGFVFEDSLLPRYAGPEEWRRLQEQGMEDLVARTGGILKATDFGYVPQSTWETTKEAYSSGNVLDAAGETLAFGFEQGTHSLADMVATVYALPTYILARSQEIGESRAKNKGMEQATIEETIESAPFAVGSAILERILPAKVFGGMSKKEVTQVGKEVLEQSAGRLKEVLKATGSGLITEATTEAIQEGLIEYIGERYGTDAPILLREALDRGLGGAVGGGTAGGIMSGTMVTINVAVNSQASQKMDAAAQEAQRQAIQADHEQRQIDNINDLAEGSKLRQRDPEAFHQFVEQSDGENNTNVFIDGVQAKLYLADKDVNSDPALKMLAEKVNDAASLGHDVAIPVADFATQIAGTQHFEALRDFMTLSGQTAAPFRQEQAQQETREYVSRLMEEAQDNASQYVESQEIFETVRQQLVDTGMVNEQNAGVMAQVVPAWAAVYAQKNGITVQEAYQRSGLIIEGPQTGRMEALQREEVAPVEIPTEQVQERIVNRKPVPDRRTSSTSTVETEQRQDDRRQDAARRERVAAMSPEEQYRAIYTNELTGLNNRRAFEEDIDSAPVVVSIDVDSLKTVNDNLGHDSGDQLLKVAGKAIHEATGGKAYHISGDEFYVLGDNQAEIESNLEAARQALSNSVIASERGRMTGVDFTYGVADNKVDADHAMEQAKGEREARGERAPRGELPRGMVLNETPENRDTRLEEAAAANSFEKTDNAEEFYNAINAAKSAHKKGASVHLYTLDEYKDMDLFLADEGRVGFAVKSDGDLVSVFKHPDSQYKSAIQQIVPVSIQAGVRKLDAFEGYLTEEYSKAGFVEVGREKWNEEYRPEGWTEDMGKPDVVFMEYRGPAEEAVKLYQSEINKNVLSGAPTSANIPGRGVVELGIHQPAVEVAKAYMQKAGMPYRPLTEYTRVDVARAKKIAAEFDKMKHDPKNPAVKAAYDAMIKETIEQYKEILKTGIEIEFVDMSKGDPYANSPYEAVLDVVENNHLYVFSTRDGFGSDESFDPVDNPLLQETEFEISGQTALANDIFRAVHDYFGHVKNGVGFRANGEENAWQSHAAMYSPLARRAMTTETRGQNSWLNFGPHGEKNRTAKIEDTVFADQKIGLLPEWVSEDGRLSSETFAQSTSIRKGNETLRKYGLTPGKTYKTREVGAALEARQRVKYGKIDEKDHSEEASKKIAKWMVEEVLFEMESDHTSGVGWYSEKFQKAIDTFSDIFPEFKTDKNARDTLTALIAITSDGQKVVPNFKQAVEFYKSYRDTGEFKSDRRTQRQSSVDGNIKVLSDLIKEMGVENTHQYLMGELQVKELNRLARESGVVFKTQYKTDVKLPRAALIFGPKLGAFYANLMGSDGYLTMDRWWSRTFNRYRGTLLQNVTGTSDSPTNAKGEKIGLARFKELIGKPDISDDEALSETIAPRNAYADRNFKNGTDIEKAANTIYKAAFENLQDTPLNASDRSFMLETVERASKSLKRRGKPTSVADIQAILWYYEKRLYGELGARQTADISYEDAAKRIVNEFDRSEGSDIQDRLEQDIPIGEEEFGQKQKERGYYEPSRSLIRLTESADLSTFLHEFAHFMYEMELKATPTVEGKNTVASIHNWFKRNAKDVAKEAQGYYENFQNQITEEDISVYLDAGTTSFADKDAAIRRATHEQFARGFETYLMEGKAPSMELRNIFRTFARWLTQVYKSVRGNLRVNLDDQMREVFDRLLATEEQIAAAEARAQYAPLFTDATMAGMTEEEFRKYKEQQQKVKDKETETLRDKLISEITRQTKTWWKEEKQDIIDEQLDELRKEPVYRAIETLRSAPDLSGFDNRIKEINELEAKLKKQLNKKDADSDSIIKQIDDLNLERENLKNKTKKVVFKLDHATVKEMVGFERTDKRGRTSVRVPDQLRGMTVKGAKGVHPDEAAAFFGFNSGDEMLKAIIDAVPIGDKAAAEAEAIMLERHGDIMHDGTIEQQADEAVQSEERGKLILDELKALRRGTNAPKLDRATIKQMAEENIAKLSYREIFPHKYRKAEIRAAQESAAALAKGNKEAAATAKARQVLNYYLGMAATDARNNTLKIVDRMNRYNKKKVREEIQKAENGYWEQLVKILNRFEFRKSATLRQVDEINEDINSWMKARMDEDGDALVLTPAVLNETFVTHWKNVAYSDLQGISDSVKNIEHVARYSNKLTRMGEEIEFRKLVDRWVNHMEEAQPSRFQLQRTDVVKGRHWGRWAMAQMTKIPYMASWLDGGERVGLSHDILVQPMTDAADAEIKLWGEVGNKVLQAIEGRSKADIKRHNRKVFIEEIKDQNNDGNLMGHQILAVALNTGNQGNLRKMLLGEGWANPENDAEITLQNPKLQAVLKHMTKSDWELVQLIWDQMEELYPQLADVHRKTTGLVPPKVEATPVQTPFGTFKGGYYPVKYDSNRSHQAEMNEEKLNAQTDSMFSTIGSIQASVNASATNERTKYYAPIRLSLDVVPGHFQETIHYITHHDAVREVNKLIRNKSVADIIKAKLGPEEYAQLKPWLNDIAKDGREAPTKMFWDDMLGRLRFGMTLGTMGFRVTTGLIQISGLSNTVAEVGAKPVLQAARSILGGVDIMRDAWDFASSNSKVLNHRTQTMDREIKNAMSRIAGKRGMLAAVQEASMKHIAYIQTYMVDLPSWYAAYIKKLDETGDEQKAYQYADWVVENVQGSGMTKDMARIMRGQSESGRMFTMFMTFFSSLWNMERDLVRGARSKRYSVTTTAAKLAFLFSIPVLFEMLLRGELEDEDEDLNLQGIATKTAMYPVASVPFVRDIAGGLVGEFGYNMSPIASIMESGTRSMPELVTRPLTDEEITKSQAKGASRLTGAALGIPGINQAWATGEHLYEVIEDGEDLTVREFLFGPDRD